MKIRNLWQGRYSLLICASKFHQLACNSDWGEQALVCQFYYDLRDEIKDLLLSLSDPSTLNEAISQAVRYNNCLFKRKQEKRGWTIPQDYTIYSTTFPTNVLDKSSVAENMQIDGTQFKALIEQEKRR